MDVNNDVKDQTQHTRERKFVAIYNYILFVDPDRLSGAFCLHRHSHAYTHSSWHKNNRDVLLDAVVNFTSYRWKLQSSTFLVIFFVKDE